VYWGNTSPAELIPSVTGNTASVLVPAGLVTTTGNVDFRLGNPALYVADSTTRQVLVVNPKPTVNGTNPTQAVAGQEAFILEISGTDFLPSAAVFWNTVSLPGVTFINSSALSVTVPSNLIPINQTSAPVVVQNPTPSAGDSDPWPFPLTSPTLVFQSPASTVGVGSSVPFTVALTSGPQGANRTVNLTVTPNPGGNASLPVPNPQIIQGGTQVSFPVIGTLAGAMSLQASLAGFSPAVTATTAVNVVSPTIILTPMDVPITGLPLSTPATISLTINHAQVADRSVALSTASPPSLTLPSSFITLPAGALELTFQVTRTLDSPAGGSAGVTAILPAEAGGGSGSTSITFATP
jgi:hypothetical protein